MIGRDLKERDCIESDGGRRVEGGRRGASERQEYANALARGVEARWVAGALIQQIRCRSA